MTRPREFSPTKDDIEWAANFGAINALLENCKGSEKAALLLSTCRNAHLTANALFVDLQVLMGDAIQISPVRAGCELMALSDEPKKIKEHFARAIQTIREFEVKRDVWSDRRAIWDDIQLAKDALRQVDRLGSERVDLILRETRIIGTTGDGWSHALLAINLEDRPNLEHYFLDLDRISDVLRYATELGWNVATAIDPQPQLMFGNLNSREEGRQEQAAARVPDLAKDLARACGWPVIVGTDELTIELSVEYRRPRNRLEIEQNIQFSTSSDGIKSATSAFALLIREALYYAHSEMCKYFTPNVAKPPMPPPFEIDLPPPIPVSDKGYVSSPKLLRKRCDRDVEPGDLVRIAIANLAVGKDLLNGYRLTEDAARTVKDDVRLAVHAADEGKCAAIVFPEYSVPSSMEQELVMLAERHKLVIVAGLDGQWVEGKLCDQAIVAIPGEEKPYFQRKQEPSLQEEAGQGFYRDGVLRLFTNSPIGDFAVVMCSDFMQLSMAQTWKSDGPLPELLFVVARNAYHEMYQNLAKADSVRLYAAIVIANVVATKLETSNAGSCVIVPNRYKQVLDSKQIEVSGKLLKDISVIDIPLGSIRARSRGKADEDYFAVPISARRDADGAESA